MILSITEKQHPTNQTILAKEKIWAELLTENTQASGNSKQQLLGYKKIINTYKKGTANNARDCLVVQIESNFQLDNWKLVAIDIWSHRILEAQENASTNLK